jgi:hypothetical protein
LTTALQYDKIINHKSSQAMRYGTDENAGTVLRITIPCGWTLAIANRSQKAGSRTKFTQPVTSIKSKGYPFKNICG